MSTHDCDRSSFRDGAFDPGSEVAAFANALPSVAAIFDAAARMMVVNQRLLTFLGATAGQLTGRGFAELLHPDDRAAFDRAWCHAVATGEAFELDHRLKDDQGTWCWFLCRAAPYRSAGSDATWIALCTEIEDRKCAEQQLARSEAWYRSTFDHAAVGIAHLSPDGVVLDVNARLGTMLLRDRADMLGVEFGAFCGLGDADRIRAAIASLRDGGRDHFICTKRYLKSDGSTLWGYLTVSARRDDAGSITHLVAFIEDVTAHKARQERLEQTLAASGAVGWEWYPSNDDSLHCGDVHAVFGRKLTSGEEFFDCIVPDDRAAVRAAAQAMLDSGQSYNVEFRVTRSDGEIRWVRDEGHRLLVDGQPRCAGLLRDITAERLARNALEEREERLRLAFAASRTSAWDWSIVTGEVTWSDSLAAYLGLGVDGFGGTFDAFWALVHPDDRPHLEQELQAALDGVRDYAVEFRMVRPDGSIRWTSTRATVLRDAEGRPVRMVGVDSDITDRKAAESAASATGTQLRVIVEAMPQIVWSTLPDGYHDYYNGRWYEFTGVPAGSTDGAGWNDIFHPDDQQRAWARWRQSLDTGEPYEIEYRLRHHTGDYRWVLGRALPVRDADGRIVRWLGTCTDIHEMVETREALRKSRAVLDDERQSLEQKVAQRTAELIGVNQRLREEIGRREATQAALLRSQKLEALGQLVSGVSHDFNNVIQAVAGGYGLITRRTSDPVIASLAGHGVRAAERGGRLVKQLMSVARQQALDLQSTDLCQMLAEAEPLLARSAGDRVTVVIDCPTNLPPVQIDQALLETALINLAVNARDAIAGSGTLTVSVADCPVTDNRRPPELEGRPALVVSVADTGSGMTPEVLQRVVEPFFTTKAPGRGTGLGLAMVAAFLRQAGGAFRIESHVGVGTTIRLYLQRSSEPAIPAVEQADWSAAAGPRLSVLLIDNDPDVRGVVAAQLRELGHRVFEAAAGRLALGILAEQPVDLVLTDLIMPDMDGIALASTIHTVAPTLPVLFMTGHPDHTGLDRYTVLSKPFSPERLDRAIQKAVEGGRSGRDQLAGQIGALAARVRSPSARDLLLRWSRLADDRLPPLPDDFDWGDVRQTAFLVTVDQSRVPMTFHFAEAGSELEARLGRPLTDADVPVMGDDHPSAREQAFRRCARSGRPAYDYVRMNLGDGTTELFERLLLPFAKDGTSVDVIIGFIDLRALPTEAVPATPGSDGRDAVGYHVPDLARRIEALPQAQVDGLSFGAIKLDADGKIVVYSDAERRLSGSGTRPRLDRYFFVEIAPCMDTPAYRGRIERARRAGHLDLEFSHVGDFANGHRELTVRVQSASDGGTWIFMRRPD